MKESDPKEDHLKRSTSTALRKELRGERERQTEDGNYWILKFWRGWKLLDSEILDGDFSGSEFSVLRSYVLCFGILCLDVFRCTMLIIYFYILVI